MFYLLISVLLNVWLFLSFRSFPRFGINTLPAVTFNYLVCVLTGLLYQGRWDIPGRIEWGATSTLFALPMGMLFILAFYLGAITSQRMGISVSSVASKMSMVLPMLFSIFVMQIPTDDFSPFNYAGMGLALLAVLFTAAKKDKGERAAERPHPILYLLPAAVFITGGTVDITINYSNFKFIHPGNEDYYPLIVFCAAGITGLLMLLILRIRPTLRDLIGGIYLGVPNYFSLIATLKALDVYENNGAMFYPVFNICIILGSTLASVLLFRERLRILNLLGLLLAVFALVMLSHQALEHYITF
jgi:multidrug transporter EmrE-like cation transporter